jgi:ABC-type nitrate/sulfonate/bicarbonate transport system permease component
MSFRVHLAQFPLPALGAFLVVLLAWQAASYIGGSGETLPPPSAVLLALVRSRSMIGSQAAASLEEAYLGLGVALAVAFLSSVAFVLSVALDRMAFPLVVASQTIPLVAIAPALASLIGTGTGSTILITGWLCWFPAVITFSHGLRDVPPDQMALFQVAGASRWQTLLQLRIPTAAPSIVAGVRSSAGFALIGALVSEYSSAHRGLGAVIMRHVRGVAVLPAATLWAFIVVCSILGLFVTWSSHRITRLVLRRFL